LFYYNIKKHQIAALNVQKQQRGFHEKRRVQEAREKFFRDKNKIGASVRQPKLGELIRSEAEEAADGGSQKMSPRSNASSRAVREHILRNRMDTFKSLVFNRQLKKNQVLMHSLKPIRFDEIKKDRVLESYFPGSENEENGKIDTAF
jgi:hypothetical protein